MEPGLDFNELRIAREAGEFSRWDVASRLGISSQMLQRIEEGQKTDVAPSFAADYRKALLDLDEQRRAKLLAKVGSQVAA